MRDYHGLEEMTGAVSIGLLAGNVVLAIDRVLGGHAPSESDVETLRAGGSFLLALAHPGELTSASTITGSLSATGAAFDAVAAAEKPTTAEATKTTLETLARALCQAADGGALERARLEQAAETFSLLGDFELARANDLSRERQEPIRWLGRPTLSHSS